MGQTQPKEKHSALMALLLINIFLITVYIFLCQVRGAGMFAATAVSSTSSSSAMMMMAQPISSTSSSAAALVLPLSVSSSSSRR